VLPTFLASENASVIALNWGNFPGQQTTDTSTLSMAAMEASGAEADSPLSKLTAIREAGKHSSSRFCSTTAFLFEEVLPEQKLSSFSY
jgi:hypothetical protein